MLHIKHEPRDPKDNIDTLGLSGIRKLLEEDFVPKDQNAKIQAYNDFCKLYRTFKERPRLFFRRLDEARNYHRGLDKDIQFSDIWIAAFYMQRCGLSKYEKEKIWERANYVYDPEKLREAILFLYEKAHETDCTRIEGSHAVKSGNANLDTLWHTTPMVAYLVQIYV